jgi:hypothetical protein
MTKPHWTTPGLSRYTWLELNPGFTMRIAKAIFCTFLFALTACNGGSSTDTAPRDTGYIYIDVDGDGSPAEEDCDDNNPLRSPEKVEVCDMVDNDCDDIVDEDPIDALHWYADLDTDGFGDPDDVLTTCDQSDVPGRVLNDGDCDDTNALANPNMIEECDGWDNDCDGDIDEDLPPDAPRWYTDADGDGYGFPPSEVIACVSPGPDYVEQGGDCNDNNAVIHPGAEEDCSTPLDDDCDGDKNDIGALGCEWYYQDYDSDGYGVDTTGVCQCHGNWTLDATVGGDCDDYAADAHPGGQEICGDTIDQDCDGFDSPCTSMSLSAADVIYYGDTFQDQAGASVVRAGDLNNDGYDDLLYGSPHATNSSYGYGDAYVVFGPLASGVYQDSYLADVNYFGEDYGDWAGMAVASIGDNNGDGFPDIAITAPRDDDANYNAGAVYVVHGPLASGMHDLMNISVKLTGEGYEDQIGITLAAAGDVNDDGYTDFWIGAPKRKGGPPSAGTVYLMHGPTVSGSVTSAAAILTGVGYADHAGSAIASGQDLDGDGIPDTIIGAPGNDDAFDNAGAVYIFLGKVKGTKSLDKADIIIYGEAEGDQLGSAVDFAGDVNGDGNMDLLLGACGESSLGNRTGTAYLITDYKNLNGDLANAEAKFLAEAWNAQLGCSVSRAGDVNNDGYDDIMIGATGPNSGNSGAGSVYIFEGPLSGSIDVTTTAIKYYGVNGDDNAGYSISLAGDINADGIEDLFIGAPYNDAGSKRSGSVYVIFGQ